MRMTTSPVACSRAADSAAWWPKFRDSEMPTIRGSAAAAAESRAKVRSVLPSSTTTTSCGPPGRASSTAETRRRNSGRTSSSLKRHVATETRGWGSAAMGMSGPLTSRMLFDFEAVTVAIGFAEDTKRARSTSGARSRSAAGSGRWARIGISRRAGPQARRPRRGSEPSSTGLAGSPSTVAVQRGSYDALSRTTAGRFAARSRREDAVLQVRASAAITRPGGPAGGVAPAKVGGGAAPPANATPG